MLALMESKQLRATNGDAAYAAQLFNYAKYQVDYVLGGFRPQLAGRLRHRVSAALATYTQKIVM